MLLRYPLKRIITSGRIPAAALLAMIIVFSVTATLMTEFNRNPAAEKINGLATRFGVLIDSNFRSAYWDEIKKSAVYSEYRTLYGSLTGKEYPYDADFFEAEQAGAYLQQIVVTEGISCSAEQRRILQNYTELLRDYRRICDLDGEADWQSTSFLLPEAHKKTAGTIWQISTSVLLIFCLILVFSESLYGSSTEVIRTSKAFSEALKKQNIIFLLLLLVADMIVVTVPLVICFYGSKGNLFSGIPFSAFPGSLTDVHHIFSGLTFRWYIFLLPVLSLCLAVIELTISRIILYLVRNDLRALILTVSLCACFFFLSFVLKLKKIYIFNYLPFSPLFEPDIVFEIKWTPLLSVLTLMILFVTEAVLRRRMRGIHRDQK